MRKAVNPETCSRKVLTCELQPHERSVDRRAFVLVGELLKKDPVKSHALLDKVAAVCKANVEREYDQQLVGGD